MAVAAKTRVAPGLAVLLAQLTVEPVDSVLKMLAVNDPLAFSVSVHEASVTAAPMPSTSPPASTARRRVCL